MNNAPRWDLSGWFSQFNGADMLEFKKALKRDIERLVAGTMASEVLNDKNQSEWEKHFTDFEDLFKRFSHYSSYVGCHKACDANNEEYAGETAALSTIKAEFNKISINLSAALKTASNENFKAFIQRPALEDAAFYISELREKSQKTMSPELETLASDLAPNGFDSWQHLYDKVAGKLKFSMQWPDGKVEQIPMAQCKSLMQDSDRKVRQAAFINGNQAWEQVEDVCAAALNAIAGNRLILNKYRGYDDFLDVSLTQSRISRKTLDAIFMAIADCRDFTNKIIKAKTKALGQEKLAWYDCVAPLPISALGRYNWEECLAMIRKAFSKHYPPLYKLFNMAVEKQWIEAEAREGKKPGAFCTGSLLKEESRIFMSYTGSLNNVSTLAHEAGHAFHSYMMKGLRPFKKFYPMTLAETASTFAQAVLGDGILSSPDFSELDKLNVLTGTINHAMTFTVNIPIRFHFEKAFHEERKNSIVSVSRLKELIMQTTRSYYGELMAEDGLNPHMWQSTMHFYLTGVSFYNYPYIFGYLLSRGLFAMFKTEGNEFMPKFHEFLRLSGSGMAHEVARKTLGEDLENPDFWKRSILGHESELKQFEKLAEKHLG